MLKLVRALAVRAVSAWTGRTTIAAGNSNGRAASKRDLLPVRSRRRAASIAQSAWPIVSDDQWSWLARTGVRLSAGLLFLFVFLQWVGERNRDPYRCEALVKHGQWPPYHGPPDPPEEVTYVYESLKRLEDEGREPPPARPYDKWEPIGCRMHEYSRDDMMGCLGGQRLLFVGDSSVRQLFFAALRRLDHEAADWLLYSIFSELDTQQDLNIEAESVQLDFLWDPWLNSTALKAELEGNLASRIAPLPNATYSLNGTEEETQEQPPLAPAAMIVMGAPGLWAARNGGEQYFDIFQASIDYIQPYLEPWVHPSSAFPASTDERESNTTSPNYIFLSPVPVPRYDMLPDDRAQAMPLERVQLMNDYLASLPASVQSHVLTAYNDMTRNVPESYADTGLHVKDGVAERWIDIPLNVRCNGWLAQPRAPGDGAVSRASQRTCCVAYPPMIGGQAMFALGLCALIVINALAQCNDLRLPYSTSLKYTSFISVAVLYCYVADRTHLFAKTEKHADQRALAWLILAVGVMFLASLRGVDRKRKGAENGRRHAWLSQWLPENDVLPRHITDEWKGVMMAVALIAAYLDTSGSMAVFKWRRFFVSAFLFLSAYGHASYFLYTDDFSALRVATVLFRLNILPCFVSLMLDGSEYGFNNSTIHVNYFPRLVSFWFLVTYATLWVGHNANESRPLQLMGRILASAVGVFLVLVWSDVYDMLEVASQISQLFCHTDWRADAMRRLISLDLFAPFLGILVAVITHRIALVNYKMGLLYPNACPASPDQARQKEQQRRVEQFQEFNETNGVTRLDSFLAAVWYPEEYASQVQALLVCASLLAGSAFLYEAHFADNDNRKMYDTYYHPFVSSAAILAVVVLRCCHAKLRSVYLAWPAAMGRFALELSVLQSHIFLSGNGTGRLRTGFWPQPSSDAENSFGKLVATAGWKLETVILAAVFVWISHKAYAATRKIAASLFGYEVVSPRSFSVHYA